MGKHFRNDDDDPFAMSLWIILYILFVAFVMGGVYVAEHGLKATVERIWEGPK